MSQIIKIKDQIGKHINLEKTKNMQKKNNSPEGKQLTFIFSKQENLCTNYIYMKYNLEAVRLMLMFSDVLDSSSGCRKSM